MKMKKKKFPLLALAIILAAGGALANSLTTNHLAEPQYYKSTYDGKYYLAGVEGYDYQCQFDHFGTCTYYFDAASGTYKSSKGGKIVWIR
jgi:hypothetical protein